MGSALVSVVSTLISTIIVILLLRHAVVLAIITGPVPNCTEIWTPSRTPWTDTPRYRPYNSTSDPPWSIVSFDTTQVSIFPNNISLACGFNTSLSYTNLTACGFMGLNGDSVGPFSHIFIEFEWTSVILPQQMPVLAFQKKTGLAGIDTIGINFYPLNDTAAHTWIYLSGPLNWAPVKSSAPFPAVAGRHNLSVIWDNQSIITFFDSLNNPAARIDRTASDPYWPTQPGLFALFATYDGAKNAVVNQPTLTGPNTKYIIYTLQMRCISPHASDCFKTNPVPGIATCDIVEGIWRTPDINLNGSSTSDPPTILNITSVGLQVNGTVVLGAGLVVDPQSELNVTGTIILQGQLTIDLTNVSISDNTTLVLISYQNYSGRFDRIVTLSDSASSCPKYIVNPYYGKDRFSLLLTPNSCSKHEKRKLVLYILIAVLVVVTVASILTVVILVVFCKNASVFRRRVTKRRTLTFAT